MNLSHFKVHCSRISSIMGNPIENKPLTESQWEEMQSYLDKEDKITERQAAILKKYVLKQTNYNPKLLSNGIKTELIKMYSSYILGKGSIKDSNYESISLEKGTTQEWESIKLLSDYDGISYRKNERRYSNRYISGYPDIVVSRKGVKKVIDIKTPIDVTTFLQKHESKLPNDYLCQMLGYIELTKADYGEVVFCLVNLPPELIAQEVRKLKSRLFLFGMSDEETDRRVTRLQDSMVFDDMDMKQKVIKFTVHRDAEFIKTLYERVKIARVWMKQFHEKVKK
jgi:hypothetical protein